MGMRIGGIGWVQPQPPATFLHPFGVNDTDVRTPYMAAFESYDSGMVCGMYSDG